MRVLGQGPAALYLRYVKILRSVFSAFDLVHVPREQNCRADLLSKLASSGKEGRQRSVIQETLKFPRTTIEGQSEVDQLEVLQITQKREKVSINDPRNPESPKNNRS